MSELSDASEYAEGSLLRLQEGQGARAQVRSGIGV